MGSEYIQVEADRAQLDLARLAGVNSKNLLRLALLGSDFQRKNPELRTDVPPNQARGEQWAMQFSHRISSHELAMGFVGASPELSGAIRAAIVAGTVVSGHLGMGVDFDAKGGVSDLVSDADRLADAIARQAILALEASVGELVHVAEESAPDARPEEGQKFASIDGLDGSFGAAYNLHGQYAVMVAIGEMINSVAEHLAVALAFPVSGDLVCADRERGAWKNGEKILGKPDARLESGLVAFNMQRFRKHRDPGVVRLYDAMQTDEHGLSLPRLTTTGLPTSLDALHVFDKDHPMLALVHDNSPDKIKQGPWDIMPILAIAREVPGVVFLNFHGKDVNPFVPEPMIVAANRGVYNQIIALLKWASRE